MLIIEILPFGYLYFIRILSEYKRNHEKENGHRKKIKYTLFNLELIRQILYFVEYDYSEKQAIILTC